MGEGHEVPITSGPEDSHAHPAPTGRRRFDAIMATCAIFISAISLLIGVQHGRVERDLVASSSWPFLRMIMTDRYGVDADLVLGISNGGVGPAKVKTFEIFFDQVPVSSPRELLRRCCGLPTDPAARRRMTPGGVGTRVVDETVLRPGEDNAVFVLPRSETDPKLFDRLSNAFSRLTFRVCYCSILDQCWRTDLRSTDTPSVSRCPRPVPPYRFDGE